MSTKLTVKWMIVALLIGLAAGGTLTASASAPDDTDDADVEPPASAPGFNPARGAAPAPASVPLQPDMLIEFNVRLVGTAVIDGGASMAVLQLPSGTRFVREGDEIMAGMRLVKVWRNRIDVERAGVIQDMRARQGSGPPAGGEAVQARVEPERLWESHGRMGRSMYYSHYRKAQN
jgi:hypothetical protein